MGLFRTLGLMGAMETIVEGSAHGRFQPFHRGHLEYILASLERCDHLWLGITQFRVDSLRSSPKDRHRERRIHNPLTFFERVRFIKNVLSEAGVEAGVVTFIPFPVDEPKVLKEFLDTRVGVFTTVYDEWNRQKIEILRAYGYSVETLWERAQKEFSGMAIREKMLRDDNSWREQLTPAGIRIAEALDLPARIKDLAVVEKRGSRA